MWRTVLAVAALVIGVWFLIDWIVKSDRERVEERLRRLIAVAKEGGDDAVEEILAAFADDYEGAGLFSRKRIERALRRHVGNKRVRSVVTGDFKTLWVGGDIVVPLLRLTVETDDQSGTLLLVVTFVEQEPDDWRIVNVKRWEISR